MTAKNKQEETRQGLASPCMELEFYSQYNEKPPKEFKQGTM